MDYLSQWRHALLSIATRNSHVSLATDHWASCVTFSLGSESWELTDRTFGYFSSFLLRVAMELLKLLLDIFTFPHAFNWILSSIVVFRKELRLVRKRSSLTQRHIGRQSLRVTSLGGWKLRNLRHSTSISPSSVFFVRRDHRTLKYLLLSSNCWWLRWRFLPHWMSKSIKVIRSRLSRVGKTLLYGKSFFWVSTLQHLGSLIISTINTFMETFLLQRVIFCFCITDTMVFLVISRSNKFDMVFLGIRKLREYTLLPLILKEGTNNFLG